MSRHLKLLRKTGLVTRDEVEDDARVRVYRLEREPSPSSEAGSTGSSASGPRNLPPSRRVPRRRSGRTHERAAAERIEQRPSPLAPWLSGARWSVYTTTNPVRQNEVIFVDLGWRSAAGTDLGR
jgi:hypothetical protein